ncbi:MAG: AmmeMemoRadiSam system protein B, partial [Gammaproteobacteria bacterium]|nr:AmmeMemoRadiSam system protein B [Gammaproteobacteria bacterium]
MNSVHQNIRRAVVAGMFYPAEAAELQQQVDELLTQASDFEANPTAIITPHAGYIYSGPVAASVYKIIPRHQQRFHRVVLLGPSHRLSFNGMAL